MTHALPPALDVELAALLGPDGWLTGEPLRRAYGGTLRTVLGAVLETLFDGLELFGIGLSWGGYESLCLPMDRPTRTARPWIWPGPLLRIHAGLESADDLVRDLLGAFDKAHASV